MRKTLIYNLLVILFCLISTVVFSAADPDSCFTVAYGNLTNTNTWNCDGVIGSEYPGSSTNVTILHDVVLDESFTGGSKISGNWTITATKSLSGAAFSLEFGSTKTTINGTLEVDNLTFNNGTVLTVDVASSVDVSGNFTNNNNSNTISIDSPNFQVDGDMSNGNGGTITGDGLIHVDGTVTNDAGGNILGCVGAGCGGVGVTLAIELISFDVRIVDDGALVSWVSSSEINNDYFIVEK